MFVARVVISDTLASCGTAMQATLRRVGRRQHKQRNNRADNSHPNWRRRRHGWGEIARACDRPSKVADLPVVAPAVRARAGHRSLPQSVRGAPSLTFARTLVI